MRIGSISPNSRIWVVREPPVPHGAAVSSGRHAWEPLALIFVALCFYHAISIGETIHATQWMAYVVPVLGLPTAVSIFVMILCVFPPIPGVVIADSPEFRERVSYSRSDCGLF